MSRAARWGWAVLIGIGVTMVKLLSWPPADTMQALHRHYGLLIMGSVLAFIIGLAWLSLWSWGRLRPMWRDEQNRWHIDMGVMGFGVPLTLALSVHQALEILDQRSWHLLIEWQFWSALLVSLVIMLPIGLWGGRLFGAGMQWTLGRRPD